MREPQPTPEAARDVRLLRALMAVLIVGLVLSGLTAFPLLAELEWLCRVLGLPEASAAGSPPGGGLGNWLMRVRDGLRDTYAAYPWAAYGTDWLAFAHLAIAVFFVGPMLWPRRDHRWTLTAGMLACIGVIPLAAVAGQARGIPWGWRLIDMTFGIGGLVPLMWAWRVHGRLRQPVPQNFGA